MVPTAFSAARLVEAHPAAEEVVRVDDAEHHVGVGHGRPHAAEAVAGGAGIGAGALRPHAKQPARIDMGDGAAARTHRAHVHLGDAQHVELGQHRLRRDDELAVAHCGDVERGAAHVDHHEIGRIREPSGGDRRQRRPRHHAVDRPLGDFVRRHHAAQAVRDHQLVAVAALPQAPVERVDIGAHHRPERGVDGGRDRTAILAGDRVEPVAERHRDLGPGALDDLAHAPLVAAVHHRPQQADRDRLHAQLPKILDRRENVVLLQRRVLCAGGVDPPAHAARPDPGHEGLGIGEAPLKRRLSGRFAQREDVAEAVGADQPDGRVLALQQRVGRDRCAVDDALYPRHEVRERPPVASAASFSAFMKPSSNAAGVDGVLKMLKCWPASETTQSVKVPPISMQTR